MSLPLTLQLGKGILTETRHFVGGLTEDRPRARAQVCAASPCGPSSVLSGRLLPGQQLGERTERRNEPGSMALAITE